jgi:hypothetical protein
VEVGSVPVFSMFLQQSEKTLIQENLFKSPSGLGVYQIELGKLTQNTDGKFSDLTVTVKKLSRAIRLSDTDKKEIIQGVLEALPYAEEGEF